MILRDGNERLTLNMRHDTSSYSTQPHQESINMIDVYNVSHEEILKDLFATNHPSGNPTSSLTSHTDLTSPEVNDDIFDPEGDIIENLLNLDKTKDLPPYHDNPLSGNPTPILEPVTKSSSSSPTLTSIEESDLIWEEFEAYLATATHFGGVTKSIVSQVKSSDVNSSSSEIAKLTHAVNQQTSDVTTAMTAILYKFQATDLQAYVKAVEIARFFQMNTASSSGSGSLPGNTIANSKGELKAITTRSGLVLDGPFVHMPPPFINPEEDERAEETLTDPGFVEYTIKVPPPCQKLITYFSKDLYGAQKDPLHPNIPYT
ncbi:hypothetical protein Tco_0127800 [Tanacetum coccineum]